VQYAQERGIEYDVLPGPSAVITAYAASGFEGGFCFFAFLPHKGRAREEALQEAMHASRHAVLYEAPHRLLRLLEEIATIDSQRRLFLAKELTKRHQHFYKGVAQELLEVLQSETIKGEWVVVIEKSLRPQESLTLSLDEVMQLPLPKKELAKLLARATTKSVKEWYVDLQEN